MSLPNIKNHFVFDLDDTLVDGRLFCGETIAKVITRFDPSADFDRIVRIHDEIHGLAVIDLYKTVLREMNLDESLTPKLDEMFELDKEIQTKDIARLSIFDGVIDILEFLKSKNKKIYMCTNRFKSLLELTLRHNKIDQYFDQIISCIDEGYRKPDPTCLNNLITNSKVDKSEFIYFGDSNIDSQFAQNAGVEHIIFDQYLNDKNLFKKLINLFLEDKINGISY